MRVSERKTLKKDRGNEKKYSCAERGICVFVRVRKRKNSFEITVFNSKAYKKC